jgi:hypothetical protein
VSNPHRSGSPAQTSPSCKAHTTGLAIARDCVGLLSFSRLGGKRCWNNKSEKKECLWTAYSRDQRVGSWSRWGALAEQGEAGSGLGRYPLPWLPVRIGRWALLSFKLSLCG